MNRILLDVLDELERRRRRDYLQVRQWLFEASRGQEGPISPLDGDEAHDGRMAPLLLDLRDVSDVLQVSETTVKRLVRSGALPAVHLAPRVVRVRRADVEAYVEGLQPDHPQPSKGTQ